MTTQLQKKIQQLFDSIKENETKLDRLSNLGKEEHMTLEQILEATELLEEGDRLHKSLNTLLSEAATIAGRR